MLETPDLKNLLEKGGKEWQRLKSKKLLVEVSVYPTNTLSPPCALELGHIKLPSFFMGLRTPLYSRLSVFYYYLLPIKSWLVVLSQKRKNNSLGGNSFSWMILWSWKHSPEAGFSSPRVNLASVLQLPARDGASQSQHGVFQLISVPLHLTFACACCLRFCGWLLWEAPHSQASGALIWPSLLLGSPGAKASAKQQD